MRADLISRIRALNLANFTVSEDLPYTSSGEPLFIKNVKRIYVDLEQSERVALIPLMNSANIDSLVTTLRVVFSTDAKQTPVNYMQAVEALRDLKETFVPEYFRRECTVSTELAADLQTTELVFTFTKLT